MWSGQAPFLWAGYVLRTGLAVVDPWIESPGLVGAHATVTEALTRSGTIVGSACAGSVFVLPRLLTDRS
jgi:hypothetical protein